MADDFQTWQRGISPQGELAVPREVSAGETIGAGLQDIGQAGAYVAAQVQRANQITQQRNDAAWLGKQKPQAILSLDKTIGDLEDNSAEGAPGHVDAVAKAVDDYTAEFTKQAPDQATRDDIAEYMGGLKAHYVGQAGQFQKSSELALRGKNIDQATDLWGGKLVQDPSIQLYETAAREVQKTIAAQGISGARVAEYQTRSVQALGAYAMGGMATSQPKTLLQQIQSGYWDGKADPGKIAQFKSMAESQIKADEAQARVEQRQQAAIHQSTVAAMVGDYVTSVSVNGGVDPMVGGKPLITPDEVTKAFVEEPRRGAELVQRMQTAKQIGTYRAQVQTNTNAEDQALVSSVAPKPGGVFTGDQADILKAVVAAVDDKQKSVAAEVKQDITDSQSEASTKLAARIDDANQTAFSTGKVPEDIDGLIGESGLNDAQKAEMRAKLQQQVELGNLSRQATSGTLTDDKQQLTTMLAQVGIGGEGSALAAQKAAILKQVIDDKQRALATAPADFVIGGDGAGSTPIKYLWNTFSDLQQKADKGAPAAGRAAVDATIAAQIKLGVPEYQAQALPTGLAKDYAYRLNSAPADQRGAIAQEVMNLGPRALAQVMAAGAPSSTAAYASVGGSDPVWTASMSAADQLSADDMSKILKAKGVTSDQVTAAVNGAMAQLGPTLPPSSLVTYQDAITRVTVQGIGRGLGADAAAKVAAAPFINGSSFSGTLRVPSDFTLRDVTAGLRNTMGQIASGTIPVKAIPSGLPGSTPETDMDALKRAARVGGLTWMTNEDGTAAILTVNGRFLQNPDGSRFEVPFTDAQAKGRALPKARPVPGAPAGVTP